MSGHSKWSTIKHKKGALDAKRGKIFSKIIKEITIAARNGGDPDANPQLRAAILKARAANMPKDNMDRAIKKGTGELGDTVYEELMYEAYAPGGVGLIIETLTDNKNRTAADVRTILTKKGGQLASAGSVSYQFQRKGTIAYDSEAVSFDDLFEAALEAGAEDVDENEGAIVIKTEPNDFADVLEHLQEKGFAEMGAEVAMVPDTPADIDDEQREKVERLIDSLEDNDDVQSVASTLG